MNLKDLLNKLSGTTTTGNNANTQVQSTSTETQESITEVQGTSTQHETTNSESNTIDKGKGKARDDSNSESDRDKAREDSNSESIVNAIDKGKGKASEDSYTWDEEPWDSSLHDKLKDNFNKIQEATKDIMEVQKKLASDLNPTEKSNIDTVIQKNQNNMETLSKFYDRVEEWSETQPDPYYADTYPGEADKKTLNAENELIDAQKECINYVDNILKNSETKPFDSKPSKDLQEYKNALEKGNELLKEREPIEKERDAQIEETIAWDNLREQEWEEIEQQQPENQGNKDTLVNDIPESSNNSRKRGWEEIEQQQPENQGNKDTLVNDIPESSTQQSNKKAKTSLIDDYADLSTEMPDCTGSDD